MAEIAAGLTVEREPATGRCPECHEEDLQRYEVLSEGGRFRVLKCRSCLHSLEREAIDPLGEIQRWRG